MARVFFFETIPPSQPHKNAPTMLNNPINANDQLAVSPLIPESLK